MEKEGNELRIFSILGRSFAGKVAVLATVMVLMVTAFSAASIQNPESLTPPKNNPLSITWEVTMNFMNPGGQTDYVVFGEAPDAHGGAPADSYDVAKPPAPMPPYIRASLKDNLATPYDKLWKDYRLYPDTQKTWNLSVQWYPEDEASPTTLTMSWSTAAVHASEYTTVNLCTNTGTLLKNMLVDSTYTFTCPALTTQNFKIICYVNRVNISLSTGWNLITVPIENSYWASSLAGIISGCQMVSWFDAGSQTYKSYIVGGPPSFDFSIIDGYGYFVRVDHGSTLSFSGSPVGSVSVPLSIGWNMIGWYHASNTLASTLGGAISGCQMISWFDSASQTFKTYIVGGPPSFDFTVTSGMGLFVRVNAASVWHGEG